MTHFQKQILTAIVRIAGFVKTIFEKVLKGEKL